MVDLSEISPGIFLIDTKMWSLEQFSSVYLIEGEKVALFETGFPSSTFPIMEAVERLGIESSRISFIILSHVHLDHAGGAGLLVDKFPGAKVLVHPDGVRHLVDPSRLIASARKALGKLSKIYELDEVLPIKEERIRSVQDGETIDLGADRKIRCIFAPGHAKHEICIFDELSGGMFTGDAMGLYFPRTDSFLPTTPPPDFDLGICINTINMLRKWPVKTIFYSHFGPLEQVERAFSKAAEKLIKWNDFIFRASRENPDINFVTKKLGEEMTRELTFIPSWLNHQQAELFVKGYFHYFDKL